MESSQGTQVYLAAFFYVAGLLRSDPYIYEGFVELAECVFHDSDHCIL
jgi:hypothetical protein